MKKDITIEFQSGGFVLSNGFPDEYYGFTEPDPDGNSYQPAATASWTVGLRVGLGRR